MTNLYCIRPKGFNIGNEAIQVALRNRLNSSFGEPVNVINLPATARYESHGKAGFTPATVHEINQYGDGVIVGGGNLYENGELDVDFGALAALEVPMMLFSLSMGRIYNRRGELVPRTDSMSGETLRALHAQAAISLARDEATVRLLNEAGVETALGGCPTLFIEEVPQHAIPEARSVADVLLSIRTPELMSVPLPKRMQTKADIEAVIAYVRDELGHTVRLLCHDHRDIPFAASFAGIDYVYTDDVYTYLSLLKGARLVVSYRLHSVLPCLSYGTPVVKVSYDERGTSTMETVGLGEWNIDLLSTGDIAVEVIDRIERIGELEAYRAAAADRWRSLHDAQTEAFDSFVALVREHQRRNAEAHPVVSPATG